MLKRYALNVLISIDQLANALLGGDPIDYGHLTSSVDQSTGLVNDAPVFF